MIPNSRKFRFYLLFPFFGVLPSILSVGCGPNLKAARKLEERGKLTQALDYYRQIAHSSQGEEARIAEMRRLKLAVSLKRWPEASQSASHLIDYLNPNSRWYARHSSDRAAVSKARAEIAEALFSAGEKAFEIAQKEGDEEGYRTASWLFRLYGENFSGTSREPWALLRRGIALAVRGNCQFASEIFKKLLTPGYLKKFGWPEGRAARVRREARRGELSCRLKTWLDERYRAKGKPRKKALREEFESIFRFAQSAISEDPGIARELLVYSEKLRRSGASPEALRFLLLVYKSWPKLRAGVGEKILQLFSTSSEWNELFEILGRFLEENRQFQRDPYWSKLRKLAVFHTIRQVKKLEGEDYRRALEQLLSTYRFAASEPEGALLLYRAALLLEQRRKYREALEFYTRIYEADWKKPLAAMALYRRSELLLKLKRVRDSLNSYFLLSQRYPTHPIASRALYLAYSIARRKRLFKEALRYRRFLLQRYPNSLEAKRLLREEGGRGKKFLLHK